MKDKIQLNPKGKIFSSIIEIVSEMNKFKYYITVTVLSGTLLHYLLFYTKGFNDLDKLIFTLSLISSLGFALLLLFWASVFEIKAFSVISILGGFIFYGFSKTQSFFLEYNLVFVLFNAIFISSLIILT